MAIAKREMLVALINSLDRAEKRFFTAHYQRRGTGEDDKFYQLFVHLCKGGDPTNLAFRQQVGVDSPGKMANLQRHLYAQIMESLRRQHRRHDHVIQVQEDLDYAHLLYSRGLHLQTLLLLKKAKVQAKAFHLDLHHILILEFEKRIEGRHITRSEEGRMIELIKESKERHEIQETTTRLTNLQLGLQRYFIEKGHIMSGEERQRFHQLYYHNFTGPAFALATFRERISHQRARFWYHYCTLELEEAAACTRAWVAIFDEDVNVRLRDLNLYLKGIDRCLMLAFFRNLPEEHREWRLALQTFLDGLSKGQLSPSAALQSNFLHLRARLNQLLLEKIAPDDYPALSQRIDVLVGVDRHKQYLLRFKFACLLVRNGKFDDALDHLNRILDDRKPLRLDVMIYTRLLFICCHHRLGNTELVGYAINNLARYLGRIEYSGAYPRLVLRLLRSLHRRNPPDEALADFRGGIAQLTASGFERRELRYLEVEEILM